MIFRRRIMAAGLRLLDTGRVSRLRNFLSGWVPVGLKERVRAGLVRHASGGELPSVEAVQTGKKPTERWLDPNYVGCGTDCVGYPCAEFGLGETVRSWARAFAGAGYPFTVLDAGAGVPGRQQDHSIDAWLESQPRYATGLFFVNPDLIARVLQRWPRTGAYTIGYWLWELETFPCDWRSALDMVDEVWVPTTFVRRAVMAATSKPVTLMPMPVAFPVPHGLPRAELGLDQSAFVFLFSFDFHSYPERKNPWAVIEAFRAAFPRNRCDVQLLIKTTNGERVSGAFTQLLAAAAEDPRILIRNGCLDRASMYALLAAVDAYVSLHRAEGIGLGMAEAMYLGKPVVATGWSGNLDFMSPQEARLVDFQLVPVAPGAYPHADGQRWAEPNVGQAARFMRELADDRVAAAALGAVAAARIRRQYAPAVCAGRAIERLGAIAAALQQGSVASSLSLARGFQSTPPPSRKPSA
ncbi:MAG: glycosyltransferase family 1 protein [Rhodanobacteraceae bacterium]|nr:MAG: glycosyltransferase family 1 protein [Rhodanobacteraceae bacterium]